MRKEITDPKNIDLLINILLMKTLTPRYLDVNLIKLKLTEELIYQRFALLTCHPTMPGNVPFFPYRP